MQTLVGIFQSRRAAEGAVAGLHAVGFGKEHISFVTPEHPQEGLATVPTTDAESPGIGETISAYVGGVIGGSVGLGVGSGVASVLIPGVGPILAAGIGAAALLGIGGAAAGAAIGSATEKTLDEGVPRDDVLFYRELLKQGRSLVVASADDDDSIAAARAVFQQHGAEDVDSVRKQWEAGRTKDAA